MLSPRRLGCRCRLCRRRHRPARGAGAKAGVGDWGLGPGFGFGFGFGSEFGSFGNKKVFLFFGMPGSALALFRSRAPPRGLGLPWVLDQGGFTLALCACARRPHYGACDYLKLQKFIHCGRAGMCGIRKIRRCMCSTQINQYQYMC